MQKTFTIVQVCRRFGPVGGMERYVWELCRELTTMGHHVHVLCEQNLSYKKISNMQIHVLERVRPKPRWLAHIRFSRHVHAWLEEYRTPEMIIHSHERTADHQITTFHGPPFAKVRDLPLWKRFSLRVKMNLWLEERELCGQQVQTIVSNSMQIRQQLEYYYPTISKLLSNPIVPGVGNILPHPQRPIPAQAGIIGFVGKEWKRKGLVKAVEIITALSKQRPELHFIVAGPAQSDIEHLFKNVPFKTTLLGEVDTQELYAQFDVLLHPASNEPYGMVITEALSSGIPVVISDVCGASSEVTPQLGSTLALTSPAEIWAQEIHQWLSKENLHVQYEHSWHDTAMAYAQLYQKVKLL